MPQQWGGSAWGGGVNPYRLPQPTSQQYQPGQYGQTPIGDTQLEDASNRLAAFTYYNQGFGVDPNSLQGKYLQNRFGQVSTGYETALMEDPELPFRDYYLAIYPQLAAAFGLESPQARGENPAMAGLARTVPRGY